jgi:23S rRNA (pseudouridine1915-N3)-methyltransferase
MQINLVAVGTRMPDWVTQGFNEYSRRMPQECSLKLHEIAPGQRGKSTPVARAVVDEGRRIDKAIPQSHLVIALDVQGSSWSTEQLSEQLKRWLAGGRNLSLLVGGPDGLAESCLQRAEQRWSLSPLTLPHPLVRIMVAEQLYRAWSILSGHPYHRS